MSNLFSDIEGEIIFDERICFDEIKIKEEVLKELAKAIEKSDNKGFEFENIVYDFFEYMNIPLAKTPKTRDNGLDGFVDFNLGFLGNVKLGLQIKYQIINSTDIDSFLAALKNAELQLGTIVCKDSRNLVNYELNSRIKSILLSRGIKVKEKLLKDNININPVFVLKLDELAEITASQMRSFAKAVYKK